jgi:ribonuclease HI
MRPPAHIKEV